MRALDSTMKSFIFPIEIFFKLSRQTYESLSLSRQLTSLVHGVSNIGGVRFHILSGTLTLPYLLSEFSFENTGEFCTLLCLSFPTYLLLFLWRRWCTQPGTLEMLQSLSTTTIDSSSSTTTWVTSRLIGNSSWRI